MPYFSTPAGIATLIVTALVLFFVYRDAKARDSNPILWAICLFAIAFFIHIHLAWAGGVLYWFIRPKGRLDRCPHCDRAYLYWLSTCPWCSGPLKKDCHRCHAAIPYGAVTCPECGGVS